MSEWQPGDPLPPALLAHLRTLDTGQLIELVWGPFVPLPIDNKPANPVLPLHLLGKRYEGRCRCDECA